MTRKEAEDKLNEIEATLLAGNGRATREITRQLVQIAVESVAREKDLETAVGQLDQLVTVKEEEKAQLALQAAADCEKRITQLKREHQQTVQNLSGV